MSFSQCCEKYSNISSFALICASVMRTASVSTESLFKSVLWCVRHPEPHLRRRPHDAPNQVAHHAVEFGRSACQRVVIVANDNLVALELFKRAVIIAAAQEPDRLELQIVVGTQKPQQTRKRLASPDLGRVDSGSDALPGAQNVGTAVRLKFSCSICSSTAFRSAVSFEAC